MSEQTTVTVSNTGSGNEGITPPAAAITPAAPAATQPAAGAPAAASSQAAPGAVDAQTLAQFREAIVKANPDAIPELIAGDSFAAINASVEGAKAAFTRTAQAVRGGQPTQPPAVPAGGMQLPPVNIDSLSPEAKIAHGLAMRKAQSKSA